MKEYSKPEIMKHEPLKVVTGTTTDDDDSGDSSYWY
jgi:hypothetical protein